MSLQQLGCYSTVFVVAWAVDTYVRCIVRRVVLFVHQLSKAKKLWNGNGRRRGQFRTRPREDGDGAWNEADVPER